MKFELEKYGFIDKVVDKSDELMTRARVYFKNGYQISVIRGSYSYGGPSGLFEIAIMNSKGEFVRYFYNDDDADDVLGWQSEQDVIEYIKKVGSYEKELI